MKDLNLAIWLFLRCSRIFRLFLSEIFRGEYMLKFIRRIMAVLSGSCPDSGSRVRNLTGKRRARCDYPAGALNQPSGADGSRGKKTKPVPQGSLSAPRRQRRNRVHSEAASGRIRTETSREYLRFIEEELSSASLQTGSSFNSRSSRKRLPHEGDSRRRGKSAEELCDPRDSQTGKSGQPFRAGRTLQVCPRQVPKNMLRIQVQP